MKYVILTILSANIWVYSLAQTSYMDSLYQSSMELYSAKNYKQSATQFDHLFAQTKITDPDVLYNASCVYALNNEPRKAILYLSEVTDKYYFSDIERVLSDTDFNNLHASSEWKIILEKVAQNLKTLPKRRRSKIQNELLKTKALLTADNAKVWNNSIWSDNVLIIDDDNVVYSLKPMPNAKKDSLLYYKTIEPNLLQQTNTNQDFEGQKWAIVRNDYVTASDSCQTIIHELFHLFHLKQMNLSGNIVEYLDNHKARILLRTEFEALRNCLKSIQKNNELEAKQFLDDAIYFRERREKSFKKYNNAALELETLEGLASYTGYRLSAHTNLYTIAINELNDREQPTGLNRSFAYATGLAYGLIFDRFNIQWRTDLKHTYDFSNIYRQQIKSKTFRKQELEYKRERNSYYPILKEELKLKTTTDSINIFYQDMFIAKPVLSVRRDTTDKTYLMSYDMNSTFTFGKRGVIYSNISSASTNLNVFGVFKTTGETGIGKSGILITSNFDKITFPKPIKIEDHLITGDNYTIELNKGWNIRVIDKKGNLEIFKT